MKFICSLLAAFALLAGDAAAQGSVEGQVIQEQAAALLAQARRCPQLDKGFVDRFAARASAVITRADGQAVQRGPSGEFERISANLVMAANCKAVICPDRAPPLGAPNCTTFVPRFRALQINQDKWQLASGLR